MDLDLGLIFFIVSLLTRINCLSITKVTVPKFVQNGTEESVVLDCEYDYELEKDSKLVVKWFHENDPHAVYQWIPELDKIESSEKFTDRINKDYEISSGDEYTKRRALNILRPTTELSGMYRCHLSSFSEEVSKGEVMMVYAHAENIYLNYAFISDEVHINCTVENVYPVPEIELYQTHQGEIDSVLIDEVEIESVLRDNSYDATLIAKLSQKDLYTETLHYFRCIVSISGTDYNASKQIPYFPAKKAEKEEDKDSAGVTIVSWTILLVCLVLLSQWLTLSC